MSCGCMSNESLKTISLSSTQAPLSIHLRRSLLLVLRARRQPTFIYTLLSFIHACVSEWYVLSTMIISMGAFADPVILLSCLALPVAIAVPVVKVGSVDKSFNLCLTFLVCNQDGTSLAGIESPTSSPFELQASVTVQPSPFGEISVTSQPTHDSSNSEAGLPPFNDAATLSSVSHSFESASTAYETSFVQVADFTSASLSFTSTPSTFVSAIPIASGTSTPPPPSPTSAPGGILGAIGHDINVTTSVVGEVGEAAESVVSDFDFGQRGGNECANGCAGGLNGIFGHGGLFQS